MMYVIKNICCIGAGFVGGPTMAVMAKKCPDLIFNVVDINKERIVMIYQIYQFLSQVLKRLF